ncbi:MAG: hypothetical protein AB7W16_01475 [Candidatus Obscuribacterales bacterium]
MQITRQTSVQDAIHMSEGAAAVFEKHGVCVEYECPEAILDFPIEDCQDMCHIDDIDALVEDLNKLFDN